jgi:5-methylcytosine-specific restriction endonuclease McrA
VAEYDYQYNVGHRKEKAEYGRRRRREDPEGDIERKRRWGQDNPERIAAKNSRRRARKAGARGSHTIEEFEALCEQRGWACLCCGIPHSTSPLTRDHIVPLSRGGSDYISNIQPLCLRCNDRKGIKIIDYRQDSGMIVLPDF